MLVNHERLIETTEPRFRRYALILLGTCCIGPLVAFAALYRQYLFDTRDTGRFLKGLYDLFLDPERLGPLVALWLGGGVILVALLLLLQLAMSPELSWRSSAVVRTPFNRAFGCTTILTGLLALFLLPRLELGDDLHIEGLSVPEALLVILPKLVPAFLIFLFVTLPIVAVTIILVRLTARAWRSAISHGRSLRRHPRAPA